jgi:hypothetical protein
MKKISIEQYVEKAIENQNDPPRNFSFLEVVKFIFTQPNSKPQLVIGIGISIAFVFIWVTGRVPHGTGSFLMGLAFVLFGIFLAAIPMFMAYRVFIASKYGYLCSAQILEFKREASGGLTVSPASRYGTVKGKWRVDGIMGSFEQNFATEAPWADDVNLGKKFKVVLHPKKQKVLTVLGLYE